MRKIIVACCLLAVSITTLAGTKIPLYLKQDDPIKTTGGPQRMPQRPLVIELEGCTLSFGYGFEDVATVELLDEDENVVYTNWLNPGQTTLPFSDTFAGEYNIRLTVGTMCYIGVIEL